MDKETLNSKNAMDTTEADNDAKPTVMPMEIDERPEKDTLPKELSVSAATSANNEESQTTATAEDNSTRPATNKPEETENYNLKNTSESAKAEGNSENAVHDDSTGSNTTTTTTPVTSSSASDAFVKPVSIDTQPKVDIMAKVNVEAPVEDDEDSKWNTVGIYRGLSANVTSYVDRRLFSTTGLTLDSDNLPDLSKFPRVNLEPGTAYRFRLRAINSCGTSDWSDISSFKTCMPGFPGAPSAIKISKSHEGAHLAWEPPSGCVNISEIIEYSVYLAIKPSKEREAKMVHTPTPPGARTSTQLAFIRVFVGQQNYCIVSTANLANAHVDTTTKPAIIFRIAARNEKGYGPATQVRWLQDTATPSTATSSSSATSITPQTTTGPSTPTTSLLSPTCTKAELSGASPSKRFRTIGGRSISSTGSTETGSEN